MNALAPRLSNTSATLLTLKTLAKPLGARVKLLGHAAVLDFAGPSPAAWSDEHRNLFIDGLAQLAAQPAVRAIVLHGDGLFGQSRADRQAPMEQAFHGVLHALSTSPVPVVAAIGADAEGPGLELALACTARIAASHVSFGVRAVRAGQIPVNGTVERLPRLVGMEMASQMLVFGQRLDASEALAHGLIDRVEDAKLLAAAAELGARLNVSGLPVVSKGQDHQPGETSPDLCKALLKLRQQSPDQAAPLAVLRAMESAYALPLRRSLTETLRLAAAFARTDQARALAYADRGVDRLENAMAEDGLDVAAISARLRWPFLREAIHLLDEGASPAQIDRVVTRYGMAEGPFAQSDRLGLAMMSPGDQRWLTYSPTLDLMADARREGGPASNGWYRTDEGSSQFDPVVDQLLRGSATFQRLHRGPITDEVILERCLHATINGAAAVLEDLGDDYAMVIDAICCTVLNFPRWKGGPLYQADRMGLAQVTATLKAMHGRRNTAGLPVPILKGRASRGEQLVPPTS